MGLYNFYSCINWGNQGPRRVLVETKVLEEDWMRERYKQLALKDEKRMKAQKSSTRLLKEDC